MRVREELFSLGEIPCVLWTPPSPGPRPLILMGHGGGLHKMSPDMLARAHRMVLDGGFAVVAADVPNHGDRPTDPALDRMANAPSDADLATRIAGFQALVAERTVPEWRSVLDAVQQHDHVGAGPVGYCGMSLGCGLGVPFIAAEPRVRAAVLGLGGGQASASLAARITVPVQFVLQWDDERVPRASGLALFDAFASREKTLHANPGAHGEVPDHELPSAITFLTRHLR